MIKMTPELFNKFATKQEELDSIIREKHGISNETWNSDYDANHVIALRVEKAEFINTVFDSWKYWKTAKVRPEDIIDEAVDVIHFMHLIINKQDLVGHKEIIDSVNEEVETVNLTTTNNALLMSYFLAGEIGITDTYAILLVILDRYNFTLDDIEEAYDRKNAINHDRQHHDY